MNYTYNLIRYSCAMLFVFCSFFSVYAQDKSHNYVKSEMMLDVGGSRRIVSVQYHDGLGRSTQLVGNALNPNNMVSTHVVYDGKGRITSEWLPVACDGSLSYVKPSEIERRAASLYNDSHAFMLTSYDATGRKTSVQGPGDRWADAEALIRMSFGLNSSDSIRKFHVPSGIDSYITDEGFYKEGELSLIRKSDEDGCTTDIYSDIYGNTIAIVREGMLTQYVYDGNGLLRYVMPPGCNSFDDIATKGYAYRYDSHQRCIWKRLPGCEPITFAYNAEGRIMAEQDGRLRKRGLHRFFIYDVFGRLAVQGVCKGYDTRLERVVAAFSENESSLPEYGYTIPDGCVEDAKLEKAVFYDSYNFMDLHSVKSMLWPTVKMVNSAGNVMGMKTGEIIAMSDGGTLARVKMYDDYLRPAHETTSYGGGLCTERKTTYSFSGKPTMFVDNLYIGGVCKYTVTTHNTYDAVDRLHSVTADVPDMESMRLAEYVYDDIGRVSKVSRGCNDSGTTELSYNLRGWTTSIRNRYFKEYVYYNDGFGTPRFGGTVSGIKWHQDGDFGDGTAFPFIRGYIFSYDGMGRLTNAEHYEGAPLKRSDKYDEYVDAYSASGQPLRIRRNGVLDSGVYGLVDDLTLTYDGVRLKSVSEAAMPTNYENAFGFPTSVPSGQLPLIPGNGFSQLAFNNGAILPPIGEGGGFVLGDYEYDECGALVKDPYRNVRYEYSNFGNVEYSEVSNGKTTSFQTFVYDADGEKRKWSCGFKVNGVGNLFESATDSIIYLSPEFERHGTEWRYIFDGGYMPFTLSTSSNEVTNCGLHFYVRDHLGNNRAVVSDTPLGGRIHQYTTYYPFGGPITDLSMAPAFQTRKFNGKEFIHTDGLDLYDYGARMYDPVLAQFKSVDPQAENFYETTPYAYCQNNPVSFIDPDGKKVRPYNNEELAMIKNTLPKNTWDYIKLDKDGYINMWLINSFNSVSLNYNNLIKLVNSIYTIDVVLADNYIFKDGDGQYSSHYMSYLPYDQLYSFHKDVNGNTPSGLSTGEEGFIGKTLFPDNDGEENSPSNDIIVIINKRLSKAGAAETYSHEANGHALRYIENGGNHKDASHIFSNDKDLNFILEDMIIKSKRETIFNMKQR